MTFLSTKNWLKTDLWQKFTLNDSKLIHFDQICLKIDPFWPNLSQSGYILTKFVSKLFKIDTFWQQYLTQTAQFWCIRLIISLVFFSPFPKVKVRRRSGRGRPRTSRTKLGYEDQEEEETDQDGFWRRRRWRRAEQGWGWGAGTGGVAGDRSA